MTVPSADTPPLFPDTDLRVPGPDPDPDGRTPGQKRRDRQAARIAAGLHPLSYGDRFIPLHPDAPRDAARDDPRPFPRCGDCAHRVLQEHHNRTYPKCDVGGRDTSSEASDVRAWWPACRDYRGPRPT